MHYGTGLQAVNVDIEQLGEEAKKAEVSNTQRALSELSMSVDSLLIEINELARRLEPVSVDRATTGEKAADPRPPKEGSPIAAMIDHQSSMVRIALDTLMSMQKRLDI